MIYFIWTQNTLNKCLCILSALKPHLFTENITEHYFLSLREEHIWMFGLYFICACPTKMPPINFLLRSSETKPNLIYWPHSIFGH